MRDSIIDLVIVIQGDHEGLPERLLADADAALRSGRWWPTRKERDAAHRLLTLVSRSVSQPTTPWTAQLGRTLDIALIDASVADRRPQTVQPHLWAATAAVARRCFDGPYAPGGEPGTRQLIDRYRTLLTEVAAGPRRCPRLVAICRVLRGYVAQG